MGSKMLVFHIFAFSLISSITDAQLSAVHRRDSNSQEVADAHQLKYESVQLMTDNQRPVVPSYQNDYKLSMKGRNWIIITLDRIIHAIKSGLLFISSESDKVNLDTIIGTRIVEGKRG